MTVYTNSTTWNYSYITKPHIAIPPTNSFTSKGIRPSKVISCKFHLSDYPDSTPFRTNLPARQQRPAITMITRNLYLASA